MCQPHIFTHAYVSYRNKHGQVRVMCVSYKTKFGGSPNWMSQHLGEIPIVSISGYFHCSLYTIIKKIRCFHWRKSYQKWIPLRGQCPLNLKSNALNRSAILVCVHYGKYVNAILLFFLSLSLKHTLIHSSKTPSKIILEFQQYWLALKKAVDGFEMRVYTRAASWMVLNFSINSSFSSCAA